MLVAVADPTNVVASDDLRLAIGLNVRLAVASAPELMHLIDRAHRTALDIDAETLFEELEEEEDIRAAAATTAPAISLVNSLIARAIDEGASDLHFEPQAKQMTVRVRVDGVMRKPRDDSEVDAAGRDEPPEDHGRARHRRAPRAAGRPHVDPHRRQADGPALRRAADDVRRAARAADHEPARRPPRPRRARHDPRRRAGVRPRDPAAVRRRARRRPDRLGQDDDALRSARRAERRRPRADDDRGSGRVPDAGRQPDRGQLQERPHVRARPAHDPPLRPGRAARRRDPRRGDGAHRDPGGDDRPPRADDAAHAQRGVVDRTPRRHGRRAEPARNVDQLHRRAAPRAAAVRAVPRRRTAPRRPSSSTWASSSSATRRSSTARSAVPSCSEHRLLRPRRALRGDDRAGPAAQPDRVRLDGGDLRRGGRAGHGDAPPGRLPPRARGHLVARRDPPRHRRPASRETMFPPWAPFFVCSRRGGVTAARSKFRSATKSKSVSRGRGCGRGTGSSSGAASSRACSARSPRARGPASRGCGRARSARSR